MAGASPSSPWPETDELVRRVLSGDLDAYATIVRRHQDELYRIVLMFLVDRTTAEGLVQQAFVNAYENLDRYETGRDFSRWLRTIARNLVREELRRRSRENDRLVHYRHYLLAKLEGGNHPHEDAGLPIDRMLEALRACRQDLPPLSTRVLDLRYGQGQSAEEIGSAIGRTAAATKQLLLRIRMALRSCMERRLAAP